MGIIRIALLSFLFLTNGPLLAGDQVLDKRVHHLRIGSEREWDSFKGEPEKPFKLIFNAAVNSSEMTLSLRQEDVKLTWSVNLNGHDLGKLDQDESARIRYLPVPPYYLKSSGNVLTIACTNPSGRADPLPDDILVGDIKLLDRPVKQLIGEVQVSVSIVEKGSNQLIPSRITITDVRKALQPVEVPPGQQLAARTGCIYTGNGKISLTLPEGTYKMYASRGFEYSVDSVLLEIKKGKLVQHQFAISREVPTQGWVSSDTHIHTFTNSGHGDATIQERLLTVAGEDIDLPVFTDHNMVFDVRPMVKAMGLDTIFTPVNGNEFTTEVGHFNVFPAADNALAPDHHVKDWTSVIQNLGSQKQVVILNHARDAHYNFRPFGVERHISIAGQDLDGWEFPANAMEVINSSSQQRDIMQLYHDWFGMLNRGRSVTPVGSSDSHDVMRYLVGQARTYIRCPDNTPGKINVNDAIAQFMSGKVMTSFGLMAEITVNKNYGPGDIAPASGNVNVSLRVLGPSWAKANRISLYANGKKIREAAITQKGKNGVKWKGSWTIPVKNQDVYLVAIAEGPDQAHPFWTIPKPYSRISSAWNPQVIGASGAVWLDADHDKRKTSAYDYAKQFVESSNGNIETLFKVLSSFDESVSVQAASILKEQNKLLENVISQAMKAGSSPVKRGFTQFVKALRESEQARQGK